MSSKLINKKAFSPDFSAIAGLLEIQGLELASDIMSPLVFLRLKKSTGSLKSDLQLLEDLADKVSVSPS